jgi:hypothetical protein
LAVSYALLVFNRADPLGFINMPIEDEETAVTALSDITCKLENWLGAAV